MKEYTVKYETYEKDVEVVTIYAFSGKHAISQLLNCKEIYWVQQVKSNKCI